MFKRRWNYITKGTIQNISSIFAISVSNQRHDDYPALENYLSSAVKLTKNDDVDK